MLLQIDSASTYKELRIRTLLTSKIRYRMTDNQNPGNFANRPKEEVRDIASKGGQSSAGGGFSSMDPQKQHDIASKGGKASTGKFEKGSERAREAGRKGGSTMQSGDY
ncbi:Conidiation-specific protein 10 [Bifiguratus adelaidae]|uniref:Conidiation-specific protein 10 n=1 Tax=Bifiguratus adelaidae TaxID=1938954 RepID=A0A261Y751_9FUNG|nr:Conidiation-specific protein 10 [Bifiguratus adelaidae]